MFSNGYWVKRQQIYWDPEKKTLDFCIQEVFLKQFLLKHFYFKSASIWLRMIEMMYFASRLELRDLLLKVTTQQLNDLFLKY